MIDWSWITSSGTALFMVFLSALGIYAALLVLTRVMGLRSFAKMSSFGFAITVAFGSILASTILAKDPPLLTGALVVFETTGDVSVLKQGDDVSPWIFTGIRGAERLPYPTGRPPGSREKPGS